MKTLKKIFLIFMFTAIIFTLIGCKKEVEINYYDNKYHAVEALNNLEIKFSKVLKSTNSDVDFLETEEYLPAADYDKILNIISKARIALKRADITSDEINKLTKDLIREYAILIPKKGTLNPEILVSNKDNLVLNAQVSSRFEAKWLTDDILLKYPINYQEFYRNYYYLRLDVLKSNHDQESQFNIDMQSLIDYMDHELKGSARFDETLDFCLMKNPFKSTHPVIDLNTLPTQLVVHTNKEEIKSFFENVKAQDARGRDISSLVYFKQAINFYQAGRNYYQIGVTDDYGNETVADKIYLLIVEPTSEKPTLKVPVTDEILAYGRAQTTEVSEYVIARDHFNKKIDDKNIIVEAYTEAGVKLPYFKAPYDEANPDQELVAPGSYVLYFQCFDEDGNFSEREMKKVTVLPKSQRFETDTEEMKLIEETISSLDLEKLMSLNFDEVNLSHVSSSIPYEPKVKDNSLHEYSKDKNAKIIVLDEIDQYLGDVYKLDGFHQMTYDIMPYIDEVIAHQSDKNLVIPNPKFVDLAHRNGVKVLGYLEVKSILDLGHFMAKDENGNYLLPQQLTKLAKTLGIDGFTIKISYQFIDESAYYKTLKDLERIEAIKEETKLKIKNEIVPMLKEVYNEFHKPENNLLVYHYSGILADGTNNNGHLSQFTLNNALFLHDAETNEKVSDMFIMDYTSSSKATGNEGGFINQVAGRNKYEIGRSFYMPTAITGDNISFNPVSYEKHLLNYLSYNDGANKTVEAKHSLVLCHLSNRIFNLKNNMFSYERQDPMAPTNLRESNNYFGYQSRLNNLLSSYKNGILDKFALSSYAIEKPMITSEVFKTNFKTGIGYFDYENGEVVKDYRNRRTWNTDGGYNNLDMQEYLPVYRQINKDGINWDYDYMNAYNGSNSLRFSGKVTNVASKNMLYRTNITFGSTPTIDLRYLSNINGVKVSLLLAYIDGSDHFKLAEPIELATTIKGAWTLSEKSLNALSGKTITAIGFEFSKSTDDYLDFNIGEMIIGDKTKLKDEVGTIQNIEILQQGHKYYREMELELSFDKLDGNYLYSFYQVDSQNKKHFLSASNHNHVYLYDIKRFANNPADPNYPTLEEYDKKAKILVVATDKVGNKVAEGEIEATWDQKLVKGGKAKVRMSSTVAEPNEYIVITPVLSSVTKSYDLVFLDPEANWAKIEETGQYVVSYPKEGYYSFKYTTKNPYGEDELFVEQGIIISGKIPKEVDLTVDAKIDDRAEMQGIKYGKSFTNLGERPSFLIDSDENGGPNLHTKWCALDKGPGERWVIIEFDAPVNIKRFNLAHCAASLSTGWDMGNINMNTREYEIYVSMAEMKTDEDWLDPVKYAQIKWTKVVHLDNNYETFTEHILEDAVTARLVKLNVVNGGGDITARVYDMRMFGSR